MSNFIEVTDDSGCELLLNTDYIYEILSENNGASIYLTVNGDNGLQLVVKTATTYDELRHLLVDD